MRAYISVFLFTTQLLLILGSITSSTTPLLRLQDKCRITDSECLKGRFQTVMQAFAEGIPETGFDQLDPMIIDNLNIDKEGFKILMKDVHLNGLKNAVIEHFSIDPNTKLVRLVFRADLFLTTQYATNGILFSLPISGEGDFTVKIDNVEINMQMPYEIVKDIYGREVLHLMRFDYSYDVKNRIEYHLTNLYYGDKQASDKMHELINTNWKILSVEYGKYLFDLVCARFFNALRKAILTQPMRDVLLM